MLKTLLGLCIYKTLNVISAIFCSGMSTITVDCHYGGCFSRDWLISYTGGDVKRFEGLDPDKFSFFELCGYVEEDLNIKKGTYRLWWMPHYEVNFLAVKVDADVSEMKEYALKVNKPVNFFVEHDVDEVSRLVDVPNCVTVTNREGGQRSQVDVNGEGLEKELVDKKGKGVLVCSDDEKSRSNEDESDVEYFDDSEHERALGIDDGFGPYDITPLDMNEVVGLVGANGKEGGKGGAYEKGAETKKKNQRLIKKKMIMILTGRESMKVMSFIQMTLMSQTLKGDQEQMCLR
jgi:hypothetical protein